jgi:hypothetical protein
MTVTKISYATCPLCEATCGLEIETRGREIPKMFSVMATFARKPIALRSCMLIRIVFASH